MCLHVERAVGHSQINNADPKSVPEAVVAAVAGVIRKKSQALEVNQQGTRVKRKISRARCHHAFNFGNGELQSAMRIESAFQARAALLMVSTYHGVGCWGTYFWWACSPALGKPQES
eukprot:scaffold155616_cov19-Tisochrysis_lutea.AAC.1